MNSAEKNPDIETLYTLFRTVQNDPDLAPQIGGMIRTLSEESHPPTRYSYGKFELKGLKFTVDVSDRFGLACFYGSDQEKTDLALFTSLCGQGSVVWDIGSNFGLYAVASAAIVGPEGHVYAAEPNRNVYSLLKQNIKDNGFWGLVLPMDCAISNVNGEATFYEARESAFSGLSDTGRAHIEDTHVVKTFRLDLLWHNQGRKPIDLIKIDVEGHEGAVFEGAMEAMEASPNLVVQFEFSPKNLDDQKGGHLRTALTALEAKGWNFWFHSRDKASLFPTELDRIFAAPDEHAGNLFIVRAGSEREESLTSLSSTLDSHASAEPLTEEVFLKSLRIMSAFRHRELFAETQLRTDLENAVRLKLSYLNPDLRALQTSIEGARRSYPPKHALDPRELALPTSLTIIIRVIDEGPDMESLARAAKHLALGLPHRIVFADGRPFALDPLAPVAAHVIMPPCAPTPEARPNRYAGSLRAALAGVTTSHVLLVDASNMPKALAVREAMSEWGRLAKFTDYPMPIGAISFPLKGADGKIWLEDTFGGMLTLRSGMIARDALFHAGLPDDDLYLGDGFDFDLSLRLWHSGVDIVTAPARTALPDRRNAVRHAEDDRILAEQWSGIYTHPAATELFKERGLRPLKP